MRYSAFQIKPSLIVPSAIKSCLNFMAKEFSNKIGRKLGVEGYFYKCSDEKRKNIFREFTFWWPHPKLSDVLKKKWSILTRAVNT